jgi:hypothetical protein
MAVDARLLRRFVLEDDPDQGKGTRGRIVELVEASSFTTEYLAEPDDRRGVNMLRSSDRFGLYLKPGSRAKALFGLDREVLLWCSTFPTFQARDIEALRVEVEREGTRLSRQFVLLVTTYEPDARSALEGESDLPFSVIHVSLEELASLGLEGCLSRHLYARDLFDVSGAVVRSADFFGRRELLDSLVGEVETGSGQIGVFGLRKVGKTSVLNRLADRLRGSGRCVVARLDLQWTTSINPSPEYTLWSLASALHAAHKSVRSIQGYRLFGVHAVFSQVVEPASVWEDFAHDLQLLMAGSKRRICILVDEIERMIELTGGPGFVRFWRLLRGLDQQFSGRLRYVIGGTSPQCAESGSIDGLDNPLFKYLRLEYLGPLSSPDARTLLSELGGLMGLSFSLDALNECVIETGGHPALLRTMGSVIHHAHIQRTGPTHLAADSIRTAIPSTLRTAAATLDQMISAVEDAFPDEYEMLTLLADGQVYEFREHAEVFPSALGHLVSYGFVDGTSQTQLRVRMLQTHLQRRRQGRVAARAADREAPLAQGLQVGNYQIGARLSSGGYCDVYEALDDQGQRFALKIFRNGNLSSLQREVEILTQLSHPQIVKVIDALQTPDGRPCMVMEMVSGRASSAYCNASEAPSRSVLISWIRDLLSALAFMHPDTKAARRLEERESMSTAEYEAWDRAKHGYIHRDIKPDNIIISDGRGPVLIDFNISSRAGTSVQTVSATPGYLDGIPIQWTPAVDLYAFGVTFAELGAGARINDGARVPDLLAIVRDRVGPDFAGFLRSCMSADVTEQTASDLRSEVLRLPIVRPKSR